MKKKVRLIASDLDGTLLDERKQMSGRNRKALEKAAQQGILFVPATGRIFSAIPEPVSELPFVRYVITVNGSGLYDRVQEKMLFEAKIPCKEAIRLCHFVRRYGTMFDCYLEGHGYMERHFYERIDEYCVEALRSMVRATRKPVEDLPAFIEEHGDVQKVQMFFLDMELRARAFRELAEAFPDMLATSSIVNNIEVNIREANKGAALTRLCGLLGIDMAETVAFGDGGNDVTLLQAAGTGVAMANACEEALAAADAVTLSNAEDGIAEYLEKYVL